MHIEQIEKDINKILIDRGINPQTIRRNITSTTHLYYGKYIGSIGRYKYTTQSEYKDALYKYANDTDSRIKSKAKYIPPLFINAPKNEKILKNIIKNHKTFSKTYPELTPTVYQRPPPKGSLKYRVRIMLKSYALVGDFSIIQASRQSYIDLFGTDKTCSTYVSSSEVSNYKYSNTAIYINFDNSDDIIMLIPLLSDVNILSKSWRFIMVDPYVKIREELKLFNEMTFPNRESISIKKLAKWTYNGSVKISYMKHSTKYAPRFIYKNASFGIQNALNNITPFLEDHSNANIKILSITLPANQEHADLLEYQYNNKVVISDLPYEYKVVAHQSYNYKTPNEHIDGLVEMLGGGHKTDTHYFPQYRNMSYAGSFTVWVKDDTILDMISFYLTQQKNCNIVKIEKVIKGMADGHSTTRANRKHDERNIAKS